jgi:acyl carrier protein|tara:strand:- start:662 stop:901 length:240 start_codon:yes stop_codon:yes gene_type:complete
MNRIEIFEKVQEVFIDVLEEDVNIKEEYSAVDVEGWDSLTHIMLIVETEKKFNIKFLSSEIISWENIGKMIDCIEQKIK